MWRRPHAVLQRLGPSSAVGGYRFYGIRFHLRARTLANANLLGGVGTAHPRAGRLRLRTEQVRISSQEKYTHDEEVGVGRSSLR
jgi:hypothetical protein